MEDTQNGGVAQVEVRDGRVLVQLGGGRTRTVGRLNGRTLCCKRDPEKHLLRMLEAYGVSFAVATLDLFDILEVHLPGEVLTVGRKTLLARGKVLTLGGFERQVFLPVRFFHHEPAGGPTQLGLFA